MKYQVLYNPIAGIGDCKDELKELREMYGNSAKIRNITRIEDFDDYLEDFEEDDKIIICGGDGSLNRLINHISKYNIKNEILYYAQGTGNDFILDVKDEDVTKPFSFAKYMKDLPKVEVNGESYRFINGVGAGFDGYCCEVGNKLKTIPGKKVNYTSIAVKGLLFNYKPCGVNLTVDGKSYRYEKVWLATAMKGKYCGGGMMFTPNQDRLNEDGSVSIILFHGAGKFRMLTILPTIFKGEHINHEKQVTVFTGHEISVEFDRPQSFQMDGETITNVKSYKVTADKKAEINA